MSFTPTDVAVQALDAIGSETTIADIEEGSREARVLLRAYWTCLRQLLSGAHWTFARKMAPLTMLADATGNTPNVGTLVVKPWLYEYALPTDCVKPRFVPHNGVNPNVIAGNWSAPSIWGDGLVINPPVEIPPGAFGAAGAPNPLVTGLPSQRHLRPAKFILSSDTNYPPAPGQELWAIPGVGNMGRTVILTNVYQAQLVYTEAVLEPQRWTDLFRAAMVAYLASEVALPLSKDKKFGLVVRKEQIAIVKGKLDIARATDGNSQTNINDISVDWMTTRRGEQWQDPWFGPRGERYDCGWDGVGLADGVY
jgi:hypothetical protein